MQTLDELLTDVRACRICAASLPLGPRPVLQASTSSRILIAGQAPGRRVHETGLPFNDPSGDRLRRWLGIDRETFYDAGRLAIIPMGFCYPGTGKSGDLPPRPECAATWHDRLLDRLPKLELTVAIGQYALAFHLKRHHREHPHLGDPGGRDRRSVAEQVAAWRDYAPELIPLPHPSPRNQLWLKRNPWFEQEVVPELRNRVRQILGKG